MERVTCGSVQKKLPSIQIYRLAGLLVGIFWYFGWLLFYLSCLALLVYVLYIPVQQIAHSIYRNSKYYCISHAIRSQKKTDEYYNIYTYAYIYVFESITNKNYPKYSHISNDTFTTFFPRQNCLLKGTHIKLSLSINVYIYVYTNNQHLTTKQQTETK